MRKLIEDAEFQGLWISFAIYGLLGYSFTILGCQDMVLLSGAILSETSSYRVIKSAEIQR